MFTLAVIFALICSLMAANKRCTPSFTTVSGVYAPKYFCPEDLIFEERFDDFDLQKWQHEVTLAGGGNWEFQWYTNNRTNSFVRDGRLYIKPSLTADDLGYEALYKDTLDLGAECTNSASFGCKRTGSSQNILNPIKSARIRTHKSFSFKYGTLEVRAKMPAGDWIWPAIWLLPTYNAYGTWPASGEIDIVESRGNRDFTLNGRQIGTQLMGSTLHWGIDWAHNGYQKTHWEKSNTAGYDRDFHVYQLVWTPNSFEFYVDAQYIGGITPPEGGFWELGQWGSGFDNPWKGGTKMAPFDQEFHIVVNNAVGGVSYFPDNAVNPQKKPWANNSTRASADFWENRDRWLNTWNLGGNDDAALQIEYIKVYAL